jgi:protocatechuate 3,4-dioxygenase beta subunit
MRRLFSYLILGLVLVASRGSMLANDGSGVMITSIPALTGQIGHQYTNQVIVQTTPAGSDVSYELHNGPSGMSIDGKTGLVTWTPSSAGSFKVEIRVRAKSGGDARQEYTLRVLSGSPGMVAGTVKDKQGTGIPGVRIRMFELSNEHFLFSTMTDSNGAFAVGEVDPGTYLFRADPKSGSSFSEQWFNGAERIQDATPVVVAESSKVSIDFVLGGAAAGALYHISGTVTDSSGSPIAGARVSVFHSRRHDDKSGSEIEFEGLDDDDRDQHKVGGVLTDSLGDYTLELPGRKYILSAHKEGYGIQFWDHRSNPLDAERIMLSSDTVGFDFSLRADAPLLGSISGAITSRLSNKPVEAHVVGFHRSTFDGVFDGFVRHAETDSLGNYTLKKLKDGFYVVLAMPEEQFVPTFYDTTGGSRDPALAYPVAVAGASISGINILVQPDTVGGMDRVRGKVSSNGKEIPGAIVFAYSAVTNDVVGAAVSEAGGAYALVGLAPGSYTIQAVKPGFAFAAGSIVQVQNAGTLPGTTTKDVLLGSAEVTSAEVQAGLPGSFTLAQNYPNPFNPSTTIGYTLGVSDRVSIKVFNVLGQQVATLFDGVQAAGSYQVRFDASRFASGVYVYRLVTGSFSSSRKMVLMK